MHAQVACVKWHKGISGAEKEEKHRARKSGRKTKNSTQSMCTTWFGLGKGIRIKAYGMVM